MQFHIWDFLSTEGFQPHGFCLLWRPDVFWTHVLSDTVIALSYFSIPAALIYLTLRRNDLMYRWVFYLFGAFIIACGVTHAFGIWTLWVPDYGLQAILKAATALISVTAAAALWPLMPKLLALPSPRQLEEKNTALAREVAEREAAEVKLQTLNEELERRVAERTETLQAVNRELDEARAHAERANRAKSDFLAMMSHELRTPLNAIIGFSELIKDEHELVAERERRCEYAAHIHESGQLLLDLINDILDLSKIESGADELHEECIEVEPLVSATVSLLAPFAERSGVALELRRPARWAALRADPRKLKQILINLLSNAIKFTPAGGRAILSVLPEAAEGYLFRIADSGIGIAAEDLSCVFTPFGQVDSHLSRRHPGTGLGLPLAKALTEMHGGTLEVRSEVGKGTTVTIGFPRERQAAAAF
jgi:signal transduction histidine kinase